MRQSTPRNKAGAVQSGWRRRNLPKFIQVFTPFCLLAVSFLPCVAQNLGIIVYRADEGLAQSQVKTIVQDRNGYLWFGTEEGLSRFDGLVFKNYMTYSGLAENEITACHADGNGRLWFGHTLGGLTVYDPANDALRVVKMNDGVSAHQIQGIVGDAGGNIWMATRGGGLLKYDGHAFRRFTTEDGLISDELNSICLDENGVLWLASRLGITLFNPTRNTFRQLSTPESLVGSRVTRVKCDSEGRIWIATDDGALIIRNPPDVGGSEPSFEHHTVRDGDDSDDEVLTVYEDKGGHIWLGTIAKGVLQYVPPESRQGDHWFRSITTIHGLSSNTVTAVFQDREDNYWFGTWGGGVCRYRTPCFETYTVEHGLIDNSVWSILKDREGNFWFASEEGVVAFTPSALANGGAPSRRYTMADGLTSTDVLSMYEDETGRIWFGTQRGGVCILDPRSDKFEYIAEKDGLIDNDVMQVAADKKGVFWFATYGGGAVRYDPTAKTFENFTVDRGLGSDFVYTLHVDRKDDVWFATEGGGLSRYDGHSLTTYSDEEGLPARSVMCLAEDVNGKLWIGTQGHGLFYFDGEKFRSYTVRDGLSGNHIYSVLCDNDNGVWVGTVKGVDKLDQRNNTIRNYGRQDGFLGGECNQEAALLDSHGNLWFGAVGGAVKYVPRNDTPNNVAPIPRITSARLFLKDAPLPLNNKYSHRQNHLTFDFVGLSFTIPDKVRYRYKLEGFDEEWSPPTAARQATYSNVPPGEYAFLVMARNNDGVWSESPAAYHFEVALPFWRTLWFYLLSSLIVASCILSLYKARVRGIEREKRALEAKVGERTGELAAEKERLAVTLRSIGDGVIATDTTGHVVLMNDVAEALTGWNLGEAMSKPLLGVFNVVDKRGPTAGMRGERPGEGAELPVSATSNILLSRDGTERIVTKCETPIVGDDGLPAGRVIVFRDVTEIKRMEEAMATTQKFESLGVMASGIAHDFNNLLTGVLGHASLALTKLSPEAPLRPHVEQIEHAGRRAADLAMQMLTFSGNRDLVRLPMDLSSIVQEMLGLLDATISKKITLECDLAPALPAVEGDVSRIRQVVMNLIVNASEALGDRGGTVTLRTATEHCTLDRLRDTYLHEDLPEGVYVYIEVADNGSGMDRETLERIFDPFFTTKFAGRGLGLSTVLGIVRSHRGAIDIASTKERGTTFRILLPASNRRFQEEGVRRPPKETWQGTATVLVVDDEEVVRTVVLSALSAAGLKVLEAKDGREALHVFRERANEISLVLLDLTMPHMDGRETCRVLRKVDPAVKIVLMSGYKDQDSARQFKPDDLAGVLQKPFSASELVEKIRPILNR